LADAHLTAAERPVPIHGTTLVAEDEKPKDEDGAEGADHLADWGDEEYEPEGVYETDAATTEPPAEAGTPAVDDRAL